MNKIDVRAMRRSWYALQLEANGAESKPTIEQLIVTANQCGMATILAEIGIQGMAYQRDVAKQHLAVLKERLEMELLHADIDGTLVHDGACPTNAGDECNCGAYEEAEARIINLVKSGRLTGITPSSRNLAGETLAEQDARVMATIEKSK